MSLDYNTCLTCMGYTNGRFGVLVPALAEHRAVTGETSQQILDRYMAGIHERHLSGLSLSVAATEGEAI